MVATTLEAAQHGASLVKVRYDADKSSTDITKAEPGEPTPYARGDAEAGLSSSAVRLDLKDELARNHHNPMEPHATVARWDGNRVTVWDKTQWVVGTHAGPPLVGTVIAVLTLLPLIARSPSTAPPAAVASWRSTLPRPTRWMTLRCGHRRLAESGRPHDEPPGNVRPPDSGGLPVWRVAEPTPALADAAGPQAVVAAAPLGFYGQDGSPYWRPRPLVPT